MLRLCLALNFLFLNLYACEGGFESCKQKTLDSASIVNNTLQIPVKNNQRLIYSHNTPNMKIIKHDPYLSLYLVESTRKFKYPFRINNKLSLGTAAVNNKRVVEGRIKQHQIGLNSFATYNEPISYPSILVNSCCALEGVVTPDGIIEKEYIERFLKVKKVSYSDIGVRVVDDKKFIIVKSSNPFMDNNPFKKDDCILELDNKKVKDSATFMRNILFSKVGSKHKVKIKRGPKVLTFNVVSQKRDGGGYLSDTFLEFLGLSFDKNLHITKIEKRAEKYDLLLGDKLLQINGEAIKTEQDILDKLANSNESSSLLFQREEFQFFIHVN